MVGVKASDYYSTVDTRWLRRQDAAVEAHSHLDKCALKKIQFAVVYDRQMRKAVEYSIKAIFLVNCLFFCVHNTSFETLKFQI